MTVAKQDVSELEAPSVPVEEESSAPASARDVPTTGADRQRHESHLALTKAHLAKQKKVTVRVQEDTYVAINGYGYLIKGKTKVQVPEQVADLLEEAGRI